ncbi:MAG: HEAT repeat domain-containing protein, partial [Planctomycetota bacterium]
MPKSRFTALLWFAAAAFAAESIDALVAKLKDPDAKVREAAAEALGESGKDAASAAPALREALQDPERAVRLAAARALERIEPPAGAQDPKALAKEAVEAAQSIASLWETFINDRDKLSDDDLKRLIATYERAADLYAAALEIEDNPAINAALSTLTKKLRMAIFVDMGRDAKKRPPYKPPPEAERPPPGPEEEPEERAEPEAPRDFLPELLAKLAAED